MRYYSAKLGRFLNQDPIEEAGGINLYAFCGNDGVNRWDMLGNSAMGDSFIETGSPFSGSVDGTYPRLTFTASDGSGMKSEEIYDGRNASSVVVQNPPGAQAAANQLIKDKNLKTGD
jgi:uncharacterized protein RhaS with RHS repeats